MICSDSSRYSGRTRGSATPNGMPLTLGTIRAEDKPLDGRGAIAPRLGTPENGKLLFQLLRQVILIRHFSDRMQLSFEPVDVVFFVQQNLLQQFARPVIADCY